MAGLNPHHRDRPGLSSTPSRAAGPRRTASAEVGAIAPLPAAHALRVAAVAVHIQVLLVTTATGWALAVLAGAVLPLTALTAGAFVLVWAARSVLRRAWSPSSGWDRHTALAALALVCLPMALAHGYGLARPEAQGFYRLVALQAFATVAWGLWWSTRRGRTGADATRERRWVLHPCPPRRAAPMGPLRPGPASTDSSKDTR